MRVIIVEDEIKTRNGLAGIIKKYTAHEIIACAEDGMQGIEQIKKYNPDLVFSDIRMPAMDGLTMIEELRKSGMETRVIFLTGYSDFSYAVNALKLGAEDYLLKPLNIDDILTVLEKVQNKIEEIRQSSVSWQQLIHLMLHSEGKKENYARQLEQQLHIIKGEKLSLFLIKVCSHLESTVNEMASLLEEILPEVCFVKHYVFRIPEKNNILILIPDGNRIRYIKQIFAAHILPALGQIGTCLAEYEDIGSMCELPDKLEEMNKNFIYGFGIKKGQILDEKFIQTCHFDDAEYPEQLEQRMRREIRNGNRNEIKNLAKDFQTQIIESNISPWIIREYTLRFMLAAINIIKGWKNSNEQDSLYHFMFDNIMNSLTKDMLIHEYQKVWETLFSEREVQMETNNGMILHVIEFIRKNYSKDISLSDAAEVAGVTPEYLSKLFAREMEINFSTFLGNFRISMAKRMLLSDNTKIYEIAKAVGFRDTKYFNKVFRSVTGISPSEYKKSLH